MTPSCLKRNVAMAILVAFSLAQGCNLVSSSVNPQFMEVLGTPFAPVAPGLAPFVAMRAVNMTNQRVVFTLSWQHTGASEPSEFTFNVDPGFNGGLVVACPVSRLTLGSVQSREATGALIVFDDNTRQEVPALGKILVSDVDYFCGDLVIFAVMRDESTVGGYSIIYAVVDGSTQPTEFSGPDTFFLLENEINELFNLGIGWFDEP
jgi:hypothetical protein